MTKRITIPSGMAALLLTQRTALDLISHHQRERDAARRRGETQMVEFHNEVLLAVLEACDAPNAVRLLDAKEA